MPYNELTEVRDIVELELEGLIDPEEFDKLDVKTRNDRLGVILRNLISSNYRPTERKFEDGRDFFISDAGIFMPSHFDTVLDSTFPTLPIHYALSRQTYQMNIHCNVQLFGRLWKKLREQACGFILIRRHKKQRDNLMLEIIYYEKKEAIEAGVLPLGYGNAEKLDAHESKHGVIERRFIKIPWASLTYDTYYLGKKFVREKQVIEIKRRMPVEEALQYGEYVRTKLY